MRAFAFTLSLLCALPLHAETKDQLDILRARSNEQERQIRTLENEIESLYGQLALERRRSKVTIPSSSSAVRSGAAKTKSYVVTTGDTLSSIAREHRCSVVSLMRANSIEVQPACEQDSRLACHLIRLLPLLPTSLKRPLLKPSQ